MVLFMIINLLSGVNPSVLKADTAADTAHFKNYTLEQTDNATGVKLTQKASSYNNGSFDVEMTVEGNEDSTTKMHSLDVVLAIDTSNSMGEPKILGFYTYRRLKNAKKAAKSFAEILLKDSKNKVRVAVVGFGDKAYKEASLTSDKNVINKAIDSLDLTGATYTQDALKMADRILENGNADQKKIVLLSDGVPTFGYSNGERIGSGSEVTYPIKKALYSEADTIKKKGISITTVGIGVDATGKSILERVAKDSGGYKAANEFGSNLDKILKDLAEEIVNKKVDNGRFVIPMADYVKFKDNLTYEVTTKGIKSENLTKAIKTTKPDSDKNLIFDGLTLGKYDKLIIKYKAELVEERKDGDYYDITNTSPELFATATATDKIVFDKIMKVKDLKTVNLVINKKWVGPVPTGVDSVEFNILPHNDVLKKAIVKKDRDWNTTVTGLPRYKDGKEIVYQLQEIIPQSATYKVSENKHSDADAYGNITFTVTNKNTEKVNYVVTKKWGNTPSELQFDTNVQLYAGENKVNNRLVTLKDNNWTATFTDLPKYNDNDDEIKYSVKEVGDKEEKEGKLTLQGYEYSVKHDTDTETNKDTITNTVTNASKKTFTAKVTKKWEGGISTNDVIFTFTNKVDANKKRDLKITSNSFKGENTWTGEIQLPKYNDNDNSLAEYTVTEVAVPGFTTTGGENKVVTASDPNVEFTNKRINKNITVTKEWGATPEKFIDEVTVVLTGTADNYSKKESIKIAKGENTAAFTVPTHTLDGKKITYKATEQGEKDGEVLIGKNKFTVDYSKENTIVNTYTGLTTDSIKLKIIKQWDGEGRVPVDFEIIDENGNSATGQNITIDKAPWEAEVTLPKWDKATGNLKTYIVNEVKTTPTFALYPFNKEDDNKISEVDKTVTFINMRVMRLLTLEKEWIGEAAAQAKFKIEGGGVSKKITLTKNKDKKWKESVDLPVYDLEGNPIEYTINEEKIEGYKADLDTKEFNLVDYCHNPTNASVIFINTKMLDKKFTVYKNWDGTPANRVSFGLYDGGNQVDKLTLNSDKTLTPSYNEKAWTGTFTKELPEYKLVNGEVKKITYVVKELDENDNPVKDNKVILRGRTYNVDSNSAADNNTFNFTNTDITTGEITYTKVWKGAKFDEAKFGLFVKDGNDLVKARKGSDEILAVYAGTDGNITFKDVDFAKYSAGDYVVRELDKEGNPVENTATIELNNTTPAGDSVVKKYQVTYDDDKRIITNTELIDITVTKTWGENVPQSEQQSVAVGVFKTTGTEPVKEIEQKDGNWTYRFENLPYVDGGYQVKETKINGVEVNNDLQKLYKVKVKNGNNIIATRDNVEITNDFNIDEVSTGKIKVVKRWTVEPKDITVSLFTKEETPAGSVWNRVDKIVVADGNNRVLETEFDKPAEGTKFEILETAIGDVALSEDAIQSILNDENNYPTQYKIDDYDVRVHEINDNVFFIKNTNDKLLTEITVIKHWSDRTPAKYIKPVKVQLYVEGSDDSLMAVGKPVELSDAGDWTYTFNGLDKKSGEDELKYHIAEVGEGKESVSLAEIKEGYKLGNYNVKIREDLGYVSIANDVNLIDITARKVWGGQAAANTVEFSLYKMTEDKPELVDSKSVSATSNWEAVFEVAGVENNQKIKYQVFETAIDEVKINIDPTVTTSYTTDPTGDISYTTGTINNGTYAVVITKDEASGVITVRNTFIPNPVIPVIPGGDTPGGTPVIPVVTPDPIPTPTPNPSTPVVDVPNDPSPQGPATPVNDGDEDNGVTEIDEDDVPQGDGKEVKKDNKANKDTVDITDNKAPKGTANLPKTGGEAGNFLSIIGLGLIGLGLVIRRRR